LRLSGGTLKAVLSAPFRVDVVNSDRAELGDDLAAAFDH
jgi:hypothetical protein